MRALTTDMAKAELRPYFLWDEDVSIGELHLERLRRRIGRRYAFWNFLIEGWRHHGLLDV